MRRILALTACAVAVGGCRGADTPTMPAVSAQPAPALNSVHATARANGFTVTTLRLRPELGSGSSMTGVFHATLGTFYPPSPCVGFALPAVQGVAVCTVLHNPGGETLTGGTLELSLPAVQEPVEVPINAFYPPSPCDNYLVRGFVAVGSDIALDPGTTIGATFTTSAGTIHTIPPGPPQRGDYVGGGANGAAGVNNTGDVIGGTTHGGVCTVSIGTLIDG